MAKYIYDVFISYDSADWRHAKEIDSQLRLKGLNPFFDRCNLPPGRPWVRALERAISDSKALIVLIGRHEFGNTQQYERELAFLRQTREPTFSLIPVILPQATVDRPSDFLQLLTWIDFSRVTKVSDAPEELERLAMAVQGQTSSEEASREAICPYRGLDPFREEDSAFFFGRGSKDDPETSIGELFRKVREHQFVMVVGRSGSGKSSLFYAGLLPALRRDTDQFWNVLTLRPGPEPLRALAALFNPRGGEEGTAGYAKRLCGEVKTLRNGGSSLLSYMIRDHLGQIEGNPDRFLLYVDQWEELYAQAPAPSVEDQERKTKHTTDVNRFIDLLLAATQSAPVTVVATVRADFYDPLIAHPAIRAALPAQQVLLGSMSRTDLKHTIVEPAKKAGLTFAPPDLVERMLDEAGVDEGMLPLLQYALKETWMLREGNRMTADSYTRSGGVREAIRTTAERTFNALPDESQQAARKLFLRLVTPGEGQEDTRARAAMPTEEALRAIVDKFTGPRTRLLVTGRDHARPTVEVSHEALIRTWPRLRKWIDDNREKLRTRAAVVQAKIEWEQHERNPELLLPKGFPLERAREFLRAPGDLTTDDIQEFFKLSSDRQEAERLAERQKEEIVLAREQAHVAKARRLQVIVSWTLAAFFVAVVAIFGGALWESHRNSIREASVFASAAQNASERGFCDRSLRLVVAGLPTADGASPMSFRSQELEGDLSLYASAHNCYFQLALAGHLGPVFSAVFSPDGRRIVTNSSDNTARIWDAATGAPVATLSGHLARVNSAAFSPDGSLIVTASADGTARIWDAAAGSLIATLSGHTGPVSTAAFSEEGGRIVTASVDSTARIWDAAAHTAIMTLSGHTSTVTSAEFSRTGNRIVTTSTDDTARIWDAGNGEMIAMLSGHTAAVNGAAFSPDGAQVVTASADNTARIWNAATGALVAKLPGHAAPVYSAAFSPNGALVVTASLDGTARTWDATGVALATLSGHTAEVYSAAFNPDSNRIVTASADGTARVWALTGATIATLSGHSGAVNSAAFSRAGDHIVTASDDQTARIWDAVKDLAITTLSGHNGAVISATFSRDGHRIVTASDDNTARIWDADSGAEVAKLSGHTDSIFSASFSRDGTRVVTASTDHTAQVWDGATGMHILTLLGHTDIVKSAGFSPDGSRVVTASDDNTARIWNAITGAPLATLSGHKSAVYRAAFSPDARRVATASLDDTARIWDSANGATLATLVGHTNFLNSAEFSPDGGRVVTASADNTARIWNTTTGAEIAVLSGHTGSVYTAVFSPDGARVLTASADGTARIWNAATGAEITTLSGHTGPVYSAAFNRDANRVVTASDDRTARIWDAATGALLSTLIGHTGPVYGAVFGPNGDRIVSASADKTARIWPLDAIVQLPADQRQSYICRTRLIGVKSFSKDEMNDPIFRGQDDLRNPCNRIGWLIFRRSPLVPDSLQYLVPPWF